MIKPKTADEVAIMKEGGHKLAAIRDQLAKATKPGATGKDLDSLAFSLIKEADGIPSFLNFDGYPASTCISINEEIVHGIPSPRPFEEGDLVGIDIGMLYKGFHTDTAITVSIGKISKNEERLLSVTNKALIVGIKQAKPGVHLGDVQFAIQKVIEKANMGIIRELSGHGIGRQLQEQPAIPNFGRPGTGPILKSGMTLAIEPMVSLGNPDIVTMADGWTVSTADLSPTAHFEHTIAITDKGNEILTI